ncbi:SusC/RagA family TonB-linked outer membrane protein [Pedobacter duraquae]|uniref:TonB-linked SusC/RagA family outer membrane protein n=1 Tax=Pedobacter duraquae TaxID=425511 RepID=A0A4R6IKG8_9SPHI|nr:TonB-dependent receptor [Pedobacter duraquae]TDO22537.1 TonB-linked SusC/RagA family outer membrane protein [Pedobacter duraquae]
MNGKFTLCESSHVRHVFSMLGNWKKYFILLLFLQLSNFANAQTITVSGTVRDPKGEALTGATVMIKGTKIGASTNVDGKYVLNARGAEDILVISYIGSLPQEIVLGNRVVLDVVLQPDSKALGEVVVVGYGTQSKRNVTGSVTKVDLSKSANLPNTNVSQALRGTVAGVQVTDDGRPGQSGSILIRGPRSLSASNNPLIVLDGIIFSGSLADINPNDIQSMEILKDASAAAIYGSRAANGVILVTSKKGTTEKPNIRFNAFNGFSDWAYKVKLLSPERYVQSKLDWRAQSGLEADPAKILTYLNKSEADNYAAGITHDPWDEASQPGRINSYDVSISGRSQYSNYYLSGAMVNEKGLIFNDNQKRTSVRANIDNQITDWFSVGINSTFVHRDLSGIAADLNNAYTNSPYGNWYYPDGQPTQFVVPEDQAYGNSVRASLLTTNEEVYDNLFSNFYAKLTVPFIKGLGYRVNYSPNYRWNHNYNFFRQDTHLTNNTTSASKFDQKNFDWVLENILTYNKQISKDHAVDFTLLYGRNHYGFESTTALADQLSSDALGFNNLGLGAVLSNTSTAEASEGISSMFRINYRFKEKYLLTLTARRDGSSVFAANNKYATFPSGSLAWIASDEPFIKKIPFIDMLKVRLSYGAVGNQAIGPYQSLSLSSTTQYVYGDGGATTLGVFPSTIANPDLKWETTYTANAAVDFELFKGRLGGTLEVYNSNTSDLLVRRSIPVMTGYNSIFANIGKTNNKGIELTLNSINIQSSKFEWGTNFVFSTNKNKIVHLYNTDVNGDGIEDNDLSNNWFIGHPITTYYDYVFDGIYQTGDQIPTGSKPGFVRLKDLNNDGKIDANDRTIIGSGGQPNYRFGLTNIFRYGNVSLSVFLNAMQGWISNFPLLNTAVSPNAPGRGLNQLDAGYWTAENKSETRPSLVYNNPLSHGWYISRNFVRIQDVSLSYQFPKEQLSKLRLANLRVFVSGKNLHTFTKWPGADPESGGITTANLYPMARTFTLGLNVAF